MEFNSTASDPLFSTFVALYTLILLYAPSLFLRIALSPVLNSTGIILLSLLRLGANQTPESNGRLKEDYVDQTLDSGLSGLKKDSIDQTLDSEFSSRFHDFILGSQIHVESNPKSSLETECNQTNIELDDHQPWEEEEEEETDSKQVFVKWNMRGPLEIIYEGEGEEEDTDRSRIEKHATGLGQSFYPESETDSSSDGDWETRETVFFKWEDEELIEISLDDDHGKKSFEFCHADEDNLIEIDIFPTTN